MDVKNVLAVYKQGPDAVISLVLRMSNRIQSLETRVQKLEHHTKKNSKNSHKSPSSDGLEKPKVQSFRGKSEKKTGGQPGHIGHTLRQIAEPDAIIRYPLIHCSGCHTSLTEEPVLHIKKRGKEAMNSIGLLPAYQGVTVHDGWASYFTFEKCQHVLCNV